MHQLRDLRLTHSSAVTDLSQSLTVLVLAAIVGWFWSDAKEAER